MNFVEFIRPLVDVRRTFEDSGISVSEWARENGFSAGLVYAVLQGKRKCVRGQSYRIAVALGLRHGQPLDVRALSAKLACDKPAPDSVIGSIQEDAM